uniref:Uncharacterized protein n=1 Tax=Nelumbo nucifera TaxID=4432 RepID=A0A822Z9C8_NELNU|nr:TPA_asm: hypothetical protein HUJ06_001124 [Nelumbo nucifera]
MSLEATLFSTTHPFGSYAMPMAPLNGLSLRRMSASRRSSSPTVTSRPSSSLSPQPDDIPRPYLAFFASGLHGPIRPILQHWKSQDEDIKVYEYLPKELDYHTFMLQPKFYLHPTPEWELGC